MPFTLSEDLIRVAEQTLGATLPSSYRAAMQGSNGGELSAQDDGWERYPIEDKSDRKRLVRTCNHIIKENEALRAWPGYPPNALAIAANGSGDQLVFLKVGTSYDDSVYAWSHETGELTKIASDFSELLSQ